MPLRGPGIQVGAAPGGEGAPAGNRCDWAPRPALRLLCHLPRLPAELLHPQRTSGLHGFLEPQRGWPRYGTGPTVSGVQGEGEASCLQAAGAPAPRKQAAVQLGSSGFKSNTVLTPVLFNNNHLCVNNFHIMLSSTQSPGTHPMLLCKLPLMMVPFYKGVHCGFRAWSL